MRKLTQSALKKRILKVLAESDNITAACEYANISREEYRQLCTNGTLTSQELSDAKLAYADRVLQAANHAVLDAKPYPLTRYGKPILDASGQPVMVQEVDVNALRFLMERLQKNQEEIKQELTDDIPVIYRLAIDARDLTDSELSALRAMLAAVDKRTARRKIASNGHVT